MLTVVYSMLGVVQTDIKPYGNGRILEKADLGPMYTLVYGSRAHIAASIYKFQ
jgi:hypothetical protein